MISNKLLVRKSKVTFIPFCIVIILLLSVCIKAAETVNGARLLAKDVSSNWVDNTTGRAYPTYIKIWEYDERNEDTDLSILDRDNYNYLDFLNPNTKTFILIHGNLDGPNSFSLKMAERIRFLDEQVQILLIDWEENAQVSEDGPGPEFDNGDDVPLIANMIDSLFQAAGIRLTDITIIGHSYGAHTGGLLAHRGNIGNVKHLVALDPATETHDLGNGVATAWLNLRNSSTYVETYMSSSNWGNKSYTYGNDNFVVANMGLLSIDDFTHQFDTYNWEQNIRDPLFTKNHSRAWEFYLSTIEPSSKLGWGWYYNKGSQFYENKGLKTKTKGWEGVILYESSLADPILEGIDNNTSIKNSEDLSEYYKKRILSTTYSSLIYATSKLVDYSNLSSDISEDTVFKEGQKSSVGVSFTNLLINRAYTSKAFTLSQLKQGASIKIWLGKTDDISTRELENNALLVGCKKLKFYGAPVGSEDYIISGQGALSVDIDFTKIKAKDYADGAYLYIQVGAQSRDVMAKFMNMKYSDYNISKDNFEPTNFSWEQGACGYIEGEINPEDNLLVIPIQFEGPVDLCFLFDTTGSMSDVLNNCKSNAIRNLNAILEEAPGSRVAVAQYRDGGDSFVYRGVCGFTTNKDTLISGINGLYAAQGGDEPEAAYYAMIQCMSGNGIGSWRKEVKNKSIILFTDAPSNNYGGYTYQDVINFAKNPNISILRSTRGAGDDETTPFTIYTVVPTSAANYYANITEETGGKVVTTYSSDEVSDAIISIIEEIIEQIDGVAAPWYPAYNFTCEQGHTAHEVWVYDGETLVTKMVVNTTEVTAADYLKAGCPGLESGKEYTFRVYEWEGDECVEEGKFTPEYNKPSSGTVTAEATENEEIYNLRVSIPTASKFMLTVYRGEEVCYPPTEFLFTDTDEEGNIITAKAVRMKFFEAGEYTVEVLGSNLAGEADAAATCTVTIAADPVITQYATWPETGYTPAEGQTLLQAGNDVMVTFTWPSIIEAESYNLKIYDCYGNLVKAVNGIIDCHTTVKLSDDIYFWLMEAVLANGKTLTSPGCNFMVAIKNDAPIISRIEAVAGEPNKVLLICDKATSNYLNVSYDIQFYTAAGGWKEYMDSQAIAVTFSDEDGDGVYTGLIDLKVPVSGAYLLLRPRVNGRLITDKQTLYRLP